jgi:hypothetical protein
MRPAEHEFTLDGSAGVVVRDDSRFETAVVVDMRGVLMA